MSDPHRHPHPMMTENENKVIKEHSAWKAEGRKPKEGRNKEEGIIRTEAEEKNEKNEKKRKKRKECRKDESLGFLTPERPSALIPPLTNNEGLFWC